jgi:hypothetical protein
MPPAYFHVPYIYSFHAAGGSFPRHWTRLSGDLPYGLSFAEDTLGALSGTPSYKATFYFTLVVKDNDILFHGDTVNLMMVITDPPPPPYICGDANKDNEVDISDAVYLVTYIFKGGPAPNPLAAGDPNCSGDADIADAVYLINYIFRDGPEPCHACP